MPQIRRGSHFPAERRKNVRLAFEPVEFFFFVNIATEMARMHPVAGVLRLIAYRTRDEADDGHADSWIFDLPYVFKCHMT